MFLHNYIPNPILLDLGFYQIRWYGLCLALAVAGGFFVIWRLIKNREDKDKIINLFFWVVIGGVVGGRIVHILTFFDYYWQRPLQIFSIWNGGIAFYGVFLGGLAAVVVLSILPFRRGGAPTAVEGRGVVSGITTTPVRRDVGPPLLRKEGIA
jgi:phosphatidylglycerol:prolipoprotein diacylglycerol transferase